MRFVAASVWLAVLGLPFLIGVGMFSACWAGLSQHAGCSLLPSASFQLSSKSIMDMPPVASSKWRLWLKTNKVRVTALVFYGRREYVRVLDAYMKQNLNKNGGVLEEVTAEKHLFRTAETFNDHYQSLDPDVYYVKLDDDTMYVGEHAIDMMLHEKLKDRFFIVSANVINHSVLTWIHAGMGAMHTHKNDGEKESLGNDYDALLIQYLEQQPFANFTYGPLERCSLSSLECAALCHFYFLQNESRNQLDRYNFHFWDFHAFSYNRWSINAILFKGSDLNQEIMDPEVSDEVFISWKLPERLDRHCGAVGAALIVHLAYANQRSAGIGNTGIVQHYEKLAEKLMGPLLPR